MSHLIMRLCGRCTDGCERGAGVKWHAVIDGTALCGARPGRRSAGWSGEGWNRPDGTRAGADVTCPRCIKKLAKERSTEVPVE